MTAPERRIYLDHNASAPLLAEARDAVVAALDSVGNPSSVHTEGRAGRALVETARVRVARLVSADADGVVFTSGASEAASTCLTPDWVLSGRDVRLARLAVLDTDHPCIRDGGRFDASQVTRLPVDQNGIVEWHALDAWLGSGEPGLLALTVANSETGVLQPAREMAARVKAAGAAVVFDVVQMAGRVPIEIGALGADALILSGHKIGAPKGIGAFVLAGIDRRPAPLITGGAQETRQRAGTEAVPMISAFGIAAEVARKRLEQANHLTRIREALETELARLDTDIMIVGQNARRLPQTVAIHHPALRAETVQIALDLDGIAVSAGSACSSGKLGASHVLEALRRAGAPIEPEAGALRVSFGFETQEADIERFLAAFARHFVRAQAKHSGRQAA